MQYEIIYNILMFIIFFSKTGFQLSCVACTITFAMVVPCSFFGPVPNSVGKMLVLYKAPS